MEDKAHLLLHCCCAPCASYVLECLIPQYNVTLLFYNPNIEPRLEYDKRKDELTNLLLKASHVSKVKLLETEYDNAAFRSAALSLRDEPEGGARCRICFELRLREAASLAGAGEYDIFATTLSVSPHKDVSIINEIGSRLSEIYGIGFLESDYKRHDGFKRSAELSKRYGLYRQNYCGCYSSLPAPHKDREITVKIEDI